MPEFNLFWIIAVLIAVGIAGILLRWIGSRRS